MSPSRGAYPYEHEYEYEHGYDRDGGSSRPGSGSGSGRIYGRETGAGREQAPASGGRRASPDYGDYLNPIPGPTRQQRASESLVYDSYSARGYHTTSSSSSYSDYRRAPQTETETEGEKTPRRSSSPPFIFRGAALAPSPSRAHTPPHAHPRLRTPTEGYMNSTLLPSGRLASPEASRKLIVLDLNGSLVLRSAHVSQGQRRALPPHPPHPSHSHPHPPPQLRTVHPRPYLSAFRTYILHTHTTPWLDTVVWSSAQPHSVGDMVDKCFGPRKGEVKAVWARDTLGLGADEYHRKTQTVKDLAKLWDGLLPLPSPQHPTTDADAVPSQTHDPISEPEPKPKPEPEPTPTAHSSLTTLLIDDSPLKAALQPWNHLVIREYTPEMRRWDVRVAEWEYAKQEAEEAREKLRVALGETEGAHISDVGEGVGEGEGEDGGTAKQPKKRKLKRIAKKEAVKQSKEEIEQQLADGDMRYDETLLAVVGILDCVKWEDNVAGWVRSGGLEEHGEEEHGEEEDGEEGSPPKKQRIAGTPESGTRLWYDTPGVLAYWAEQGRRALTELGIEVESGIVRP